MPARNAAVHLTRYRGTMSDTVGWASAAARDSYFNGLAGPTLTSNRPMSFGSVRVPMSLNDARQYQYAVMEQTGVPGATGTERKIYAWITGSEYVSDDITDIFYEIDPLTTYLPYCTVQGQSYLERREMAPATGPGVVDLSYSGSMYHTYGGSFATSTAPRFFLLVAGTANDPPQADATTVNFLNVDGGSNQFTIAPAVWQATDAADMDSLIQWFMEHGHSDQIVGAFAVPQSDIVIGAKSITNTRTTGSIAVPTPPGNRKFVDDTATVIIADLNDPTNRVELPWSICNGTINFTCVSNPLQGTRTYYMSSGTADEFESLSKITIGCQMSLPTLNSGYADAMAGIQINKNSSNMQSFVGNASNVAGSVAGGPAGLIGGIASGVVGMVTSLINNEINANAQSEIAGMQPMTQTGSLSGSDFATGRGIGVGVWVRHAPASAATRAGYYFRKFGYRHDSLVSNVTFDASGGSKLLKGDIPLFASQNIPVSFCDHNTLMTLRQAFASGVWLRPNEASIGAF